MAKRRTVGTPTAAQLDALKRYKSWAGPDWKETLRYDWMRSGSDWHESFALLMQIRNKPNLGPAWLAQYGDGGKVKKKTKKTEKVCATSGYGYVFTGSPSKWKTGKDDFWDVEMIDGGPVTLLGKRLIDGTEVCVFKKGSKVMAQTCLNVTKC